MPEKFEFKLSKNELLALRELIGQVDNYSGWMKEVFEYGDYLHPLYQKV
ncbi:MAG: hypothetical protein ACOCRO_08185 [Halanaerobiales bacterium]